MDFASKSFAKITTALPEPVKAVVLIYAFMLCLQLYPSGFFSPLHLSGAKPFTRQLCRHRLNCRQRTCAEKLLKLSHSGI